MDAREEDGSQSGLLTIKRPWEEESAMESGKSYGWHGAILPPIDSEPHHRPQQVPGVGMVESTPDSYNNPYIREFAQPEAKRPRYERNEYRTPSGAPFSSVLNGQWLYPRSSHAMYDTNQPNSRAPPPPPASQATLHLQSPRFSLQQQRVSSSEWEDVARPQSTDHAPRPIQIAPQEQGNNSLCRRCRSGEVLAHPEDIENVTQEAATVLTQLARTLSASISSDQCMSPSQRESATTCPKEYPPISQSGLRNTLNWLLGRIHHVNSLADTLFQHTSSGASLIPKTESLRNGSLPRTRNSGIIKQRLKPEADHLYGMRFEAPDPAVDVKIGENQTERLSNIEDPSNMRSQSIHRSQQQDEQSPRDRKKSRDQKDYRDLRVSIMNPPLVTLGRQLPPSPGRSIPSPISLSFPSPSASTFGGTSQPISLPPPSRLQQSPVHGFLPSIGSALPDSAMQTHSAALQHEVSVQKIALSTLQTEHDKLLAAYLRSQTRASTLEKKQNVSDSEIISLSEEKLRLQEHILELEKSIEELAKSREEYRQAAVQEGKQYVEIVKKASQLEIMAAKERESWNLLKGELEQKMEALKSSDGHHGIGSMGANTENISVSSEGQLPAPDALCALEIETIAASINAPGSSNSTTQKYADVRRIRALDDEVQRLRHRCSEMETALHALRGDSQSLEKLVEILGSASKLMLDRTSKILEASKV